jgi:hypothetical protein
MGKAKSSVSGWKSGAHKPSLREILIICYVSGITLHDFLTSERSTEEKLVTQSIPQNKKSFKIVRAPPRKISNIEEVRLKLKGYLEPNVEPLPIVHVAKLIDYGVKTLRKTFPELCKQISQRYLSHKEISVKKKRSDFVNEITSAVMYLHSKGQPLTRARIAEHLNKPEYAQNPMLGGPMQEARRKLNIL